MLTQGTLLVSLVTAIYGSLRGVNPDNKKFFQGPQFQCADGKQTFPISFVNDDYCDCQDGSDEPGTSACPNGSFHCANLNFKGQQISSSRVDDGICDCCDGSDEGAGKCSNNCSELGAHLLEEAKRIRKEQAIGFQQRMVYATDGKAAKERRNEEIKTFANEVEQLRVEMEEREEHKDKAEEPARVAKEAAQASHEEAQAQSDAAAEEEIREEAEHEYSLIDSDSDGDVTVEELISYVSGERSLLPREEIQEMLEGGEIEPTVIINMMKDKIREQWKEEERQSEEEVEKEAARRRKEEEESNKREELGEKEEMWGEDGKKIENDEDEEYEDSEEYYEDDGDDNEDEETVADKKTPVFDSATQKLIDVFEEAEALYKESKSRHDNVKRQLEDLQKLNEIDFGADEEFYALKGQCFTVHDKYTYKLCPFDKCDQGGTLIGRWGKWEVGSDGINDYSQMKYTNGNSCWQGPARSTTVQIICGSDNMLLSASEPAKCEYEYMFATPAACTKIQEETEIHDEL